MTSKHGYLSHILYRDKNQVEKKAMMNKMEEDDNEKRKEIGLIKNQLQKVCI